MKNDKIESEKHKLVEYKAAKKDAQMWAQHSNSETLTANRKMFSETSLLRDFNCLIEP